MAAIFEGGGHFATLWQCAAVGKHFGPRWNWLATLTEAARAEPADPLELFAAGGEYLTKPPAVTLELHLPAQPCTVAGLPLLR